MQRQTITSRGAAPGTPHIEGRVYERHACDLQSTCQPPSARSANEVHWRATIRDISQGGLRLSLQRRFERGTALSVELPGMGSSPASTVLVRVAHVRVQPGGGWSLGCSFVSDLGDEELAALLAATCPPPAPRTGGPPLPTPSAPVGGEEALPAPPVPSDAPEVTAVLCRLTLPGGRVVLSYIRRLRLAASWPPPVGKALHLEVGAVPRGRPVKVAVTGCRFHDGRWLLDCVTEDAAAAQALRPPGRPAPLA